MESIVVPDRYFITNLLDDLTEEDISSRDPRGVLQYFIDSNLVVEENGKAKWINRFKDPFIQIYSIQIIKSNTQKTELNQICGKIIFGEFKIFDCKPGGSRYAINKNGFLRLMGPMCPVYGWSISAFYARMYRENKQEDFFHPDNPKGYKKIYLNGGPDRLDCVPDIDVVGVRGMEILDRWHQEKPSDVIITDEITTTCGLMRYSYAIFEDAADLLVTIKLLEWNGQGPSPTIYGRISAINTRLPQGISTIFSLRRSEAILVRPEEYIPIDRPVNIVSMGHSLQLSLRIVCKHEGSRKDDVVIAQETFSFEAERVTDGSGEDGIVRQKIIGGDLAKFEVRVYWLPSWSRGFYKVEADSDDSDDEVTYNSMQEADSDDEVTYDSMQVADFDDELHLDEYLFY